jgi:lysophospholipase L1-like esterase
MLTRLLTATALSMGAVVIALLCLELAVRWLVPDLPATESDPSITVLREPNVDVSFSGIGFRTNSLGFRGPDYAAHPEQGVRRLVVTGDSFVMGWGVAEGDTYVARLERLLNDQPGFARHQVINAGLLDINIAGAMERLATAADAYSPDLVVYGATLNDIVGPRYQRTYRPLVGLAVALRYGKYEQSRSRLLRFLWPRWVALEQRFSPSIDYTHALHHNYFENVAAWDDFVAGLDEFASIAAARGLCAHVLIHTNLNDLDSDHAFLDIYRRIERASIDRGLSVTASFPYFEGRRPLDVKISLSDAHPNREGHAVLSRALFDGLRSLPSECGLRSNRPDAGRS